MIEKTFQMQLKQKGKISGTDIRPTPNTADF